MGEESEECQELQRLKAVEEYKQLATEEIAKWNAALVKAENELMNYKNRVAAPLTFTSEQQQFLEERPDYIEYLHNVKKFHEQIAVERAQQDKDLREQLMDGRDCITSALKQIHNL